MLGYDISWAAFNIIEVMSASKFTFKRIGYLAASQCFHEGTDVIMLTTNQIRKKLEDPDPGEWISVNYFCSKTSGCPCL
uniref:Clathrin/coatomer adaptor adaptin-like N-terminal domain-containing protein n=1 Tax=Calidris pygmaea TaxID=425635 RepID=A0A8C3PH15_9CHAR